MVDFGIFNVAVKYHCRVSPRRISLRILYRMLAATSLMLCSIPFQIHLAIELQVAHVRTRIALAIFLL